MISPGLIIRDWFRRLLDAIAPEGYEDEHGFHFGKPEDAK